MAQISAGAQLFGSLIEIPLKSYDHLPFNLKISYRCFSSFISVTVISDSVIYLKSNQLPVLEAFGMYNWILTRRAWDLFSEKKRLASATHLRIFGGRCDKSLPPAWRKFFWGSREPSPSRSTVVSWPPWPWNLRPDWHWNCQSINHSGKEMHLDYELENLNYRHSQSCFYTILMG